LRRFATLRSLASGGSLNYLRGVTGFDEILADFAFLDDWDDRYKYLIDLGRALPPYPEEKRDEAHKVRGCASQVWLDARLEDGLLHFRGDSDAHIVKGLVGVLLALFSGKSPETIVRTDAAAALAPLDLSAHLTPQRSNGLASMAARIRAIALDARRT
jgi:cysteine desulfuration protein SufE